MMDELEIPKEFVWGNTQRSIMKTLYEACGIDEEANTECQHCEGLGVENPEEDPVVDCFWCQGNGYKIETNLGNSPYTFKESYDRNKKVQNFSIHKSRRLLDIQNKK